MNSDYSNTGWGIIISLLVIGCSICAFMVSKENKDNKDKSVYKAEEQRTLDQRCYPYVRASEFWTKTNQYAVCITADGGMVIK